MKRLVLLLALLLFAGSARADFAINDATGNFARLKAASDPAGIQSLNVNTEGQKATYSVAYSVAIAASPTAVVTVSGSVSKTVRINRVVVAGTATAAGWGNLLLVSRTTANSGGTSTVLGPIPWSSTNGAASATAQQYTANPAALGTLAGNVTFQPLNYGAAAATNTQPAPLIVEFGRLNDQAFILRGTGQVLDIEFAGVSQPAGAQIAGWIEWTEE